MSYRYRRRRRPVGRRRHSARSSMIRGRRRHSRRYRASRGGIRL